MSAIRPLATMAILASLGLFLAMKINQDPLAPTASVDADWDEAPAFDGGGGEAPAFEAGGEAGAAPMAPAPPFSPLAAPLGASKPRAPAAGASPVMPPLLDDPPVAGSPAASEATAVRPVDPSVLNLPDLPLPADIPQATYTGDPAGGASGPAAGGTPVAPPLPPAYPRSHPAGGAPGGSAPAAAASSTAASPLAGLGDAPADEAPPGLHDASVAPAPAPASTFAATRSVVQSALGRGELTRAHLLLSQWYGDPSLSAQERREVDRLLGQLAGTVIYSDEHRLEPPHRVAPGETLQTIAQQYGTSWQLLAKINGLASAGAVRPGQVLKVVRGPFSATVDISDAELFLTLGGRYAGRFPVTLADGTPEGQYAVTEKGSDYRPGSPASDPAGYAKTIRLAEGPAATPTGKMLAVGPTGAGVSIGVAPNDLDDLFDILSEGSRVEVRK